MVQSSVEVVHRLFHQTLISDAKQRRNVVGETVEEMKKFVQSLPELRETVEKARKHVALAHMLKQQVSEFPAVKLVLSSGNTGKQEVMDGSKWYPGR